MRVFPSSEPGDDRPHKTWIPQNLLLAAIASHVATLHCWGFALASKHSHRAARLLATGSSGLVWRVQGCSVRGQEGSLFFKVDIGPQI